MKIQDARDMRTVHVAELKLDRFAFCRGRMFATNSVAISERIKLFPPELHLLRKQFERQRSLPCRVIAILHCQILQILAIVAAVKGRDIAEKHAPRPSVK